MAVLAWLPHHDSTSDDEPPLLCPVERLEGLLALLAGSASTMDPETAIREAVDVVCEFASRMNEWETRMYVRSRIENGQSARDARADELRALTRDAVLQEYYSVFSKFCTARERTYGGHPYSWAKGGQYAGVSAKTVVSANLVKPGRVEVVIDGGQFPGNQFKFVVRSTRDGWRIDSAEWRGQGGEWSRHHL